MPLTARVKATSSASVRISGMPSPLSWRRRRGSVAAGRRVDPVGIEPLALVDHLDRDLVVVDDAAHDHRTVGPGGLVRLDGVGARLGDRDLEIVEPGGAETGCERADRGIDDEADEREVGGPGRDLQLDDRHGVNPRRRPRRASGRSGTALSRPVISNRRVMRASVQTRRRSPPWVRARLRALTMVPRPVESRKSTPSRSSTSWSRPSPTRLDELLAQVGRRGDVELAVDADDRPAGDLGHLGAQLHGALTLPLRPLAGRTDPRHAPYARGGPVRRRTTRVEFHGRNLDRPWPSSPSTRSTAARPGRPSARATG